ncbi:uncharacterized protein LOC131438809 [Malaya genurostris]|uniref:uncharacterized protein LOC131438809 n=1 Tax=Malaya genurostris TaxID=325434 RepID=UPI0026F3A7F4|nr:uncharacterized protein LOC131438809 [Malaya genurostris]
MSDLGAEDSTSTNQMTTQPSVTFNCKGCERPDQEENMVACDKCSTWWHFSCAGVADSVADRSWKCNNCSPLRGSIVSGRTAKTTRLRLKHLEEKKALEDKILDLRVQKEREYLAQKHQLKEDAESDEDSVENCGSVCRFDISSWIEEQNTVSEGTNLLVSCTSTPVTSAAHISVASSICSSESQLSLVNLPPMTQSVYTTATMPTHQMTIPNQQQYLLNPPTGLTKLMPSATNLPNGIRASIPVDPETYNYRYYLANNVNEFALGSAPISCIAEQSRTHPSMSQSETQRPMEMNLRKSDAIWYPDRIGLYQPYDRQHLVSSNIHNMNPPSTAGNDYDRTAQCTVNVPTTQTAHPARGMNHMTVHSNPLVNGFDHFMPSQQSTSHPQPSQYLWPAGGVISPHQLAARHVVCRDLPKFAGDPLEWPMFLSAFESTTVMCGIQPDENLARLQKSLVGSAREKVQSLLTLPSAIPEILSTLRDECGRPEQLVHCLLSKIRNAPPPNVNKLETLVIFGREVRNLVTYIEAANLHSHLSNPMLLSELVGKLPPSLRLDWGLYSQRISESTLKAFSNYVSYIKTAACQVSSPLECASNLTDSITRRGSKREKDGFLNAHSTKDDSDTQLSNEIISRSSNVKLKSCHVCQRTEHKIRNCGTFLKYSVSDRIKFVEQNGLCKRCLTGHGRWPCRTKQPCSVNGCQEAHHKLLHTIELPTINSQTSSPAIIYTHNHRTSSLFKILPVILRNNGKSVETFAFLDDGSDLTLLDKDLADKLDLHGTESTLCLQWTGNVTRKESSSKKVHLNISGFNANEEYALRNVRTVDSLDLPRQSLHYPELVKQFPYLQGLPVQSYTGASPGILIGVDNARLKLPLNHRYRRDKEPVAIKTRLGWTIFGGISGTSETQHVLVHICSCTEERQLNEMVKDYFLVENLGINNCTPRESEGDTRAWKILRDTTRRTESGRFETGLIWKTDNINFPNSYPMANRRLKCLERRLETNLELKQAVHEQIMEYQRLGYSHKASAKELQECDSRRVWYLPLGVVCNPRKPNKIRVVWDAAACVEGISLNSNLLKGPDLLTPLLKVLCNFRQKQYAITGDIRQMFHQLLIREQDRQSQRFLWRTDAKCAPDVYIMDVATFGAKCSPCSAHYVKNLNAKEFESIFPLAVSAIVNNTYVDDYLDSRDTIDEIIKIATEVQMIHSQAGFEIRSWQSNSDAILTRVGGRCNEAVKSFTADKTTNAERVLGIAWIPSDDVFSFTTQFRKDLQPLLTGDITPTKRQVLQIVMSLFDPLGFISNYTIHGKILIQDVWRSGIEWDDPITKKDLYSWRRWITLVPELRQVRISRCYFNNYSPGSYDSLELHIFVDASEMAYCSVAYFRIVEDRTPRCSLVASKAKVTPLRPQTIPKNELNAAVLGVRLMRSIVENHSLSIKRRFIWSDSSTVLSWLRADPRKYRPYVAFRVAEILTETNVDDWHWVPTRMNIADEATKWNSGPSFDPLSCWYRGPEFLYSPEHLWPSAELSLKDPTEELRTALIHREIPHQTPFDFAKCSRFDDLIKRLSYLQHFRNQCCYKNRVLTKSHTVYLNHEDYVSAEKSLWRMVQAGPYANEISLLKANSERPIAQRQRLGKASTLRGLSPFLDEDGIIRSESRIDPKAAYYCFDFRNPVILPRENHVTDLLILRFHQRFAHANTETVINEMHQKFYIPKMRSVVKKAIKKCMWCRVYRAKPGEPRMASLPQARVQPYVRPFTFTGLDYFGPLVVKRGRSNVKRWVALFTCLTIRAVHLEAVHSLSTESCRMAIRRFVAKRGAPQQIFSDNGTNFHGAARILANEIKAINHEIAATFTNSDTKWYFNPPSAPHMGGVWERKVRSVKDAFKVLAHHERLDDEGLVTLLAEVEMIINSHPLTFVPLEGAEQDVVTPNSFLLMSSSGSNNLNRIPIDEPISLRTNWKLMQHLLNQFWKRWIQAYLPTIARRTKWFSELRPLEEGDLVIVVDESVRNGWLRGRIVKTYTAVDGQVRKVDVQTNSGVLQRPAIKVALLDVQEVGKTQK